MIERLVCWLGIVFGCDEFDWKDVLGHARCFDGRLNGRVLGIWVFAAGVCGPCEVRTLPAAVFWTFALLLRLFRVDKKLPVRRGLKCCRVELVICSQFELVVRSAPFEGGLRLLPLSVCPRDFRAGFCGELTERGRERLP